MNRLTFEWPAPDGTRFGDDFDCESAKSDSVLFQIEGRPVGVVAVVDVRVVRDGAALEITVAGVPDEAAGLYR